MTWWYTTLMTAKEATPPWFAFFIWLSGVGLGAMVHDIWTKAQAEKDKAA